MNSDFPIGGFYYYDNSYTTSGSYNWYEGGRSRSGVMSRWENNPNLGFVKRNDGENAALWPGANLVELT